jgi:hypothetical protein
MFLDRVTCNTCGKSLEVKLPKMDRFGDISIEIDPCEGCMDRARMEADETGYARGYDAGQSDASCSD